MMRHLILIALVIFLFSSCELQKRRYTKGYYVTFFKKHKKLTPVNEPLSQTKSSQGAEQYFESEKTYLAESAEAEPEPVQLNISEKTSKKKILQPQKEVERQRAFAGKNEISLLVPKPITGEPINKPVRDSGLMISVMCFSAFVLLFVFGWMFRIILLEFLILALLFVLVMALLSGMSVAGIVKSVRHVFSAENADRALAVIALILAAIVIFGFLSMLMALFFMF